nr:CONSTANS-like 1 protein [Ipomoea batatas]
MPLGDVHRLLPDRRGVPLRRLRRPHPPHGRRHRPRARLGLRGLRARARRLPLQGRRRLALRRLRRRRPLRQPLSPPPPPRPDSPHNDNINQERVNNNIKEESENACIDLLEYSSCQENQFNDHHYSLNQPHHYSVPEKNMSYGGDSVVPNKTHLQYYHTHNQTHHGSFQLQGMEYETSTPGYGYPAYSHSVSVSSMDVGVVPESTTSDVSISHSRPPKGTIDLFSGPPVPMPSQLAPMDREARVLRYREKKKTRKFEKTIRYASRKAYAETRPRIKGRFAKRTDAEGEVDQMFFTPSMAESGYGIVPLL